MFDPVFGFAYKAKNTNIKVSIFKKDDLSNPEVILDKFVDKIEAMKRTRKQMTKYAEPSSDLSDLDLPDSEDEIAAAKAKNK